MNEQEALDLIEERNLSSSAEDIMALFPKSIEEYTREDFLDGSAPYDYIYLYRDDKFKQNKLIVKMAAQAKSCGVSNFVGLYKSYLSAKDDADDVGNYTNYPEQPLVLKSGGWICDGNGARTMGERGVLYACPHPIMPVARLCNIDTGIEKIKVAYSRGKRWKTAVFDRKVLSTANKITDLSDVGIAVTSETSKNLVNYFYDLEQLNPDLLPDYECVTHLGWIERGHKREFVPYASDVIFDGEIEYRDRFNSVRSSGDFSTWHNCIVDNIRHNPQVIARIVFAASLASVLIKPFGCNNFWLHLWGESESAKTVLTMCAASIWGDPNIGSMITTFNSTYVGNEKGAAFSGSLPYMLDELQIVDSRRDMDNLIYMLTEGTGRSRGNKQGGLDKVPTWKNCIVSTGERPINSGNSNGGAVNRVIECECKTPFFTDPRMVARTVQSNFGFFGWAFIGYLTDGENLQRAEELFERFYRELTEMKITQKQAQSAALILAADTLACELEFDESTALTVSEIAEFLKTKDAVSTNPRGYEYICEQVAANQLHFLPNERPQEIWGTIEADDTAYIINSVFVKLCNDGGYNPAALLSWLGEQKIIERRDGRNTVPKRVGGILTRCVHITLGYNQREELPEL